MASADILGHPGTSWDFLGPRPARSARWGKSQEVIGSPRRSQEVLGGPGRSYEVPGNRRKSSEVIGEPKSNQIESKSMHIQPKSNRNQVKSNYNQVQIESNSNQIQIESNSKAYQIQLNNNKSIHKIIRNPSSNHRSSQYVLILSPLGLPSQFLGLRKILVEIIPIPSRSRDRRKSQILAGGARAGLRAPSGAERRPGRSPGAERSEARILMISWDFVDLYRISNRIAQDHLRISDDVYRIVLGFLRF